jgi:hypothetical protein
MHFSSVVPLIAIHPCVSVCSIFCPCSPSPPFRAPDPNSSASPSVRCLSTDSDLFVSAPPISLSQARAELGMTDEIIPPALLTLLGENFDPAVGNEFDDEEPLPSELENVSTRTFGAASHRNWHDCNSFCSYFRVLNRCVLKSRECLSASRLCPSDLNGLHVLICTLQVS